MINKKLRKFLLIFLAFLIMVLVGVSFAYFVIDKTGGMDFKIETLTKSDAEIEFISGSPLTIDANMTNFAENGNNLSSTTKPSVVLTYDKVTADVYYTFFDIKENEFVYTTDEKTPELVLVVQDEVGQYITSVPGLENATVDGKTGFDVTEALGIYKIYDEKFIRTDGVDDETIHTWTFTLYFVNLDSNQNANSGKTFDSEVVMRQQMYKPINNHIITLDNKAQGDGILFHEIFENSESELADENGIVDTGYRYQGTDPNNYISFNNEVWRIIGVFETKTVDGNVEYLTKIFRTDSIGTMAWANRVNVGENIDIFPSEWDECNVSYVLNGDYLNKAGDYENTGINNYSRNLIQNSIWLFSNTNDWYVDVIYIKERVTNENNNFYKRENESYIGLIYGSDYGYAVNKNVCPRDKISLGQYNSMKNSFNNPYYYCYNSNWMANEISDDDLIWTYSYESYSPTSGGMISQFMPYYYARWAGNAGNVLPSVYLKSDTIYTEGDGSIDNPYKVGIIND